jgi:hypothetical protein
MINENIQHEMFLDRPLTNAVPILPPQLTFNNEKITSITPYIKEIKYSPNTGLEYNNNQTIKFLINSTGFIDPYGTYLSFEIENISDRPLQFDNSAHSIISSLVISSNGNVIEEITDYDVIQSIILDSSLNDDTRRMYKDICFGSGNNRLGSEGTTEPLLYNSGLIEAINKDKPGSGDPKINRVWRDTIIGSDSNPFSRSPQHLRNELPSLVEQIVEDGCIKKWEPKHCIKIMLPLMSNIFGFGLSLQNYKWIPLEIFPNLEISITLNSFALFSPFPVELDQITDGISQDYVKQESSKLIVERITELIGEGKQRLFKIKNTQFVTTQLFFDSSILNYIRDMALKSGFTLDTQVIQSFQQKYFTQSPENTYVLNVPRKSIRSLITIFLNKNYEKFACCRKLKRYSRGITKLQVKIGEDLYPYNPIDGNSSTNYGRENNQAFLNSWSKVFYKTGQNFGDSIINNFNFAIDRHFTDMLVKAIKSVNVNEALSVGNLIFTLGGHLGNEEYHLKMNEMKSNNYNFGQDKIKVSNYASGRISHGNELVGRSIFAVSLDQIPMSGNIYKSGIDTRFTKPILLAMEQKQGFDSSFTSDQFVQYVMLEFDYTIKIGFNGFITKDF